MPPAPASIKDTGWVSRAVELRELWSLTLPLVRMLPSRSQVCKGDLWMVFSCQLTLLAVYVLAAQYWTDTELSFKVVNLAVIRIWDSLCFPEVLNRGFPTGT